MTSVVSDTTNIIPWWVVSWPQWEEAPNPGAFYDAVRTVRAAQYGKRAAQAKEGPGSVLTKFALAVEALGLDKKDASKLLRLLKGCKSWEQFSQQLSDAELAITDRVDLLISLLGNDARQAEIRGAMAPKKEIKLSPEEVEGREALRKVEDFRKDFLKSFTSEEMELMEKLRALRARRDSVAISISKAIPELEALKSARAIRLSAAERAEAVRRLHEDPVKLGLFTEESYISWVQDNRRALAEKGLYQSFRKYGAGPLLAGLKTQITQGASTGRPQGSLSPSGDNDIYDLPSGGH